MKTNHTTLAQLDQMSEGDASALPIEHLALLLEAVADEKNRVKRLDAKLNAALHARFGEFANKSRKVLDKDTGRVRWDEDGFTVVADLPAIVDWDQPEMAKAAETVRSWGEPEDDYFITVRKVPETKFKAFPSAIRKTFEAARTVRTGKPSYELVKKEAA